MDGVKLYYKWRALDKWHEYQIDIKEVIALRGEVWAVWLAFYLGNNLAETDKVKFSFYTYEPDKLLYSYKVGNARKVAKMITNKIDKDYYRRCFDKKYGDK